MPRGIPNKKKDAMATEPKKEMATWTSPEIAAEEPKAEQAKESPDEFQARVREVGRIREIEDKKRKPDNQNLPAPEAGTKYFESPEGFVKLGEADKHRIWEDRMNKGKGGWSNPKR